MAQFHENKNNKCIYLCFPAKSMKSDHSLTRLTNDSTPQLLPWWGPPANCWARPWDLMCSWNARLRPPHRPSPTGWRGRERPTDSPASPRPASSPARRAPKCCSTGKFGEFRTPDISDTYPSRNHSIPFLTLTCLYILDPYPMQAQVRDNGAARWLSGRHAAGGAFLLALRCGHLSLRQHKLAGPCRGHIAVIRCVYAISAPPSLVHWL